MMDEKNILNNAAAGIQDFLVTDVIRWGNEDPDQISRDIAEELLDSNSKIREDYFKVGISLLKNSGRYLIGDPTALATVLLRIALQRLFFKRAQ